MINIIEGTIPYFPPQLTTPKLGANSPRLLVAGGLTSVFFMVARTSSVLEPVLPIIKYVVAPLEVGPEFAPN